MMSAPCWKQDLEAGETWERGVFAKHSRQLLIQNAILLMHPFWHRQSNREHDVPFYYSIRVINDNDDDDVVKSSVDKLKLCL